MSIVLDGSGTISGLNADGLSSQPVFPGNVLQVVQTVKTDRFSASVAANTTVVVPGFEVTITPRSTSSKVLITYSISTGAANDSYQTTKLQRDEVDLIVGDSGLPNQSTTAGTPTTFTFLDSPNTSSAVTYRVVILNSFTSALTMDVNSAGGTRATAVSTITAMEIAG
jgi:hypothetical protein